MNSPHENFLRTPLVQHFFFNSMRLIVKLSITIIWKLRALPHATETLTSLSFLFLHEILQSDPSQIS